MKKAKKIAWSIVAGVLVVLDAILTALVIVYAIADVAISVARKGILTLRNKV